MDTSVIKFIKCMRKTLVSPLLSYFRHQTCGFPTPNNYRTPAGYPRIQLSTLTRVGADPRGEGLSPTRRPTFPQCPRSQLQVQVVTCISHLLAINGGSCGFDNLLEWLTEFRETPNVCQYYKGCDKG